MTKTMFAMVNNILFSFNKPVKIPLQHIDMEQNRERLLQKFSTAEKKVRVLGVGNDPESGKTVDIHGKICRERPVGNDFNQFLT